MFIANSLQAHQTQLTSEFDTAFSIDLEFELQCRVPPFREFVFRTDSITVFGEDLYPERTVDIEAPKLAALESSAGIYTFNGVKYRMTRGEKESQDTNYIGQPNATTFMG